MLKHLQQFFNPIQIIKAYQVEGYHLQRRRALCGHILSGSKILNNPIERTRRLKLTLLLGYVFIIGLSYIFTSNTQLGLVILVVLSTIFMSLIVIIGHLLLFPFRYLITKFITFLVRRKLQSVKGLKIIGITGSRGKTSVKIILTTILSQQFNVLATSGNINTTLGVAFFILKNLKSKHEVLIVEMGAYELGNIAELCTMCHPDIGIITAIGNQHLERFGSYENVKKTKMELAQSIPKNGSVFFDANQKDLIAYFDEYMSTFHAAHVFGVKASQVEYRANYGGITFVYKDVIYNTKLLAKHSAHQIALCVALAKELNMDDILIQKGIDELTYIAHRLQLIKNEKTNVLVIDDSYNGNEAGFLSTIDLLRSNKSRRKVYITPGVLELGEESKEVNKGLGEMLYDEVDLLVIIKNSASQALLEGYKSKGDKVFKVFITREECHADLGDFVKSGDCVVFQNDATQNYV